MKKIMSILNNIWPAETAYAHCDIPCGIYDPHLALIGALTCIRMMDLMAEHPDKADAQVRCIAVKEKHAEMIKHEIRVIWGDYFKPEIAAKYPELHELTHKIMLAASVARQTTDRANGLALLESVNRFAEIFWDSRGMKTKRVKAPYKPEEEIVVPVL